MHSEKREAGFLRAYRFLWHSPYCLDQLPPWPTVLQRRGLPQEKMSPELCLEFLPSIRNGVSPPRRWWMETADAGRRG